MKKLKTMILLIMILGCILTTSSYATLNGEVSVTASKLQLNDDEVFSVNVTISNLETEKGIIALGGVLEYDKTSLTLVSIEGVNGWSNPTVGESGKFASLRSSQSTVSETVLKLTFQVNKNAANTATIKINNFEISNGDEETDLGDYSVTVSRTTSQSETTKPDNNQIGNTTTSNTTSGDNTHQSENNVIDNTSNTNTQSGNTSTGNNGNSNTTNGISGSNSNNSNSSTTNSTSANKGNTTTTKDSNDIIPKLGEENGIGFILIGIIAVLAVVCGIKLVLVNKEIARRMK